MNNRWFHTLAGLLLGFITPLFLGSLVGLIQGIQVRTFVWNVFHRIPYYNTYYQLGIAINIGIFFLVMRNDRSLFFGRGWLVATILSAMWAVVIELN
jgi:hypothetical protein